jgi:hypothetical protein
MFLKFNLNLHMLFTHYFIIIYRKATLTAHISTVKTFFLEALPLHKSLDKS